MFTENVDKNMQKLNENYKFLLLATLIAGWSLVVLHFLQILRSFGEKGDKNLPPLLPWQRLYSTLHFYLVSLKFSKHQTFVRCVFELDKFNNW